jgi:hypothetical protein
VDACYEGRQVVGIDVRIQASPAIAVALFRGSVARVRIPVEAVLPDAPPSRRSECQALVSPALSFSMTWPIVKLAGDCEGGNSTSD